MGPAEPRRLLEEAEAELSHSGRGDLAGWREVRDLEEYIKEIWKDGPGIWDKAGTSQLGKAGPKLGCWETQEDT